MSHVPIAMAGRIPQSFIDELLARADIVEIINARVPLKKTGRNFVARCPFHDEKTPSFSVSPNKQFYYCFGCGVSGSAIGFLMEYDHLTFPEAIETLAAHYGLTVPRENGAGREKDEAERQRLQALYRVNQEAAVFYARQLRETGCSAVEYLRRRGVDGKIARRYGVGYAPPEWEALCRRYDAQLLGEAGLAIAKEGRGHYDRFRDRIMFPIRNRRGQVLGFGGRALGEQGPKYLNTPETPVFHKGREVYGLYEMLQVGGRPSRILVVEGYMDVIALAQQGIPYAVATLGTAATSDHVRLLFHHAGELVFCFDGDAAGRKAARRALEAVLPQLQAGRKVTFLWLPEGEDPDSLVRKEGARAFEERVRQAEPLSSYFFRGLSEDLDLSQMEDRAALLKQARPLLQRLPEGAFRQMMQARLKELAGSREVETRTERNESIQRLPRLRQPRVEERVAALLVHHPRAFACLPDGFREAAKIGRHGELLAQLVLTLEMTPEINSTVLLEKFQANPHLSHLQELLSQEAFQSIEDPQRELLDAVTALNRKIDKLRLKALLGKADREGLTQEEKAELLTLMGGSQGSPLLVDIQ